MKKFVVLVLFLCFFQTFAAAQKTVRKRPKMPPVQTADKQNSADAKQDPDQTRSDIIYGNSKEVETSVEILENPPPDFGDGQDCSQGRVILIVTFLSTGEIGSISVISGLTKGKTESAVEAARKIKFRPAMKDGKPVSLTKIVQYSFTIY